MVSERFGSSTNRSFCEFASSIKSATEPPSPLALAQDHRYTQLQCEQKPDAIFVVNDRKAIGAMLALKQLKIKIGKKMGVVGFTNDPVSNIISPGLTTVAEPALEIGRKSCELLLKHINKKNFLPQEIILPGKLIIRKSALKRAGLQAESRCSNK